MSAAIGPTIHPTDAARIPAVTRAADPPPATAEAIAVPEATAIQLDGELTEEAWRRAPVITGFVQRDPKEGAPPSFDTQGRVVYDGTALYVAVEAIDPEPAKIVGLLTRRDTDSPSDWIRVALDSYHDRRTAYEFAVNPAGVKQDRYWFNDGNTDSSWDAVWDVAVKKTDAGWRAEFRIPFSQVRFRPAPTPTFGLAIVRQIGRLKETSTWPLLAKSANGYVSSFGTLNGLTLSRSPKRLEVAPYSVGRLSTRPAEPGNPLSNSRDPDATAGMDLKYALTPNLTLTGTINPDFGQVEADPAVVNLSAFETFFNERRPFFVEGSGLFQFDTDCSDGQCTGLFYSRRIGRTPQGSLEAPDGAYTSVPAQTTILGAAKVTGKLGGFAFGALNAQTAEEHGTIAFGSRRERAPVEPNASYSVVRARREFANQSSLGFITTATNRFLPNDLRYLPAQAYSGGVDWDWRLSKKYSVTGYWAGSAVKGDAEAIDRLQRSNVHSFQRPDATHVDYDPARTSLAGDSGSIAINKIGGERVRFNSNIGFKSPGFDVNDIGYQRRADSISIGNWLQHRFDRPSKYFRSFRYNLNEWAGWNFGGDLLYSGANVNAHAVFRNNWGIGSGVNLNAEAIDDRLTRGGPAGKTTSNVNVWYYVNSDDRRAVVFNYFGMNLTDHHGSTMWNASPGVTVRPSPSISINTGIDIGLNHDQQQYVDTVAGPEPSNAPHYVFGILDQTTVGLTTRVNYTMTPTLSLQIYAQPFVSAGGYSGFKELVNGRAARYEDRYARFAYQGEPDFNYKSFRTTNVLRWEYRPGSTLFVVWQQGREDTTAIGTFRFGRDFRNVFAAPAHNVVLVKFAYWLNY